MVKTKDLLVSCAIYIHELQILNRFDFNVKKYSKSTIGSTYLYIIYSK